MSQDSRAKAEQHKKFVETARALGCDEDEAAFNEKLKAIARHKPKDEPKPTPKGSPKKGESKGG
jgi:hypothetical protein